MATTEHDVRARLRVEDGGADAKLAKLRQGFAGAGQEAGRAQASAGSFLKSVAASALAFNAASIVTGIRSTASGFVDAAAGANAARRSMAATAVVLEGVPWEQASEHAREAQREMAKIGLASGFSGGQVHEAFTSMLEATDGTSAAVERTKGELGQVAKIADAFGMSLESVGREVSFMHEGTLRTRGQLFQLLKSTGIFGSDVHKAAEGWQKMTDEERTRAIGAGLDQVSKKIANLPPSYQRLVGQVKAVFAGIEKDIGEPIVDALVPALQQIEPRLALMRAEIKQIAATMGPEIGHWIKEGANLLESGLAYMSSHAEEIRNAIREGFEYAKTVVEWILAHKEELAIAWGAKKIGGQATDLVRSVGGSGVGAAASAVGAGLGLNGIAATAAGLGTLALAAGVAAAALYGIDKAYQERKGASGGQENVKAQIEQLAMSYGGADRAMKMVGSMRGSAKVGGEETMTTTEKAITSIVPGLNLVRDAFLRIDPVLNNTLGMSSEEFAAWADSVEATGRRVRQQTEDMEAQAASGMQAIQSGNLTGVTSIVDSYNQAIQLHNAAAATYAADLLVSSGFSADALRESGIQLQGGIEEFASHVTDTSAFKSLLATFSGGSGGGSIAKAPQINMSGGQTFHIKQDFRDQDPDRVALVFRRDLSRVVERRLTARTSSPFGT